MRPYRNWTPYLDTVGGQVSVPRRHYISIGVGVGTGTGTGSTGQAGRLVGCAASAPASVPRAALPWQPGSLPLTMDALIGHSITTWVVCMPRRPPIEPVQAQRGRACRQG